MTIKTYLLIDEVIDILKVSKWTVRRYVAAGKLKAVYREPGRHGMQILTDSLIEFQKRLEKQKENRR
ncbi:MAG: helix-turn-helix domain-containing protein [Thermodesulfovibrionales bacterium]|nr:helix-turn-helix domain-containing protein [Thermodesulfovibrionales bacterium]